ncbi:ABC transporter substrate-binding protein [Aquabacterium sp.]|uniref:ABC transporter substrate-binding protein n=1 Tax=Aquabacterium sp. TaxID=1872578 RepID=UPI002CAE3FCC|nr:ABC transporter substrate-binding protein [Aquabacterium sp.]HSW08385.1 ABC transporter substrate-binding protein [Aquabacterium sp.]
MDTPSRRHAVHALAGLIGTGVLGLPRVRAAAQELVVTTYGGSWEKFWRATLVPGFTAKTQIRPTLDIGLGRTYMATMRAAGVGKAPYGVVMTNEIYASVLRAEGQFQKLDRALIPHYADLYPIATAAADGWGVVGLVSPIGIGYRTDLVKTRPTSWKDLWTNPEFKGRIGLYGIQNTAGKMMLMLASKLYGGDIHNIDVGFKKLAELGRVLQTDFNMSTLMAAGEIIVAPFDFGEIARLRRQGLPVDCITPEEGLLMWDQTFNIPQGAPAGAAHAYIDYILSPEGQTVLMKEFFVSPVNRKVVVPDALRKDIPISGREMERFLPWDWAFMNKHTETITRRWNDVVGKA